MRQSIMAEKADAFGTAAKRVRRRRYFIDTKFQLALAGNMLLIAGLGIMATALISSWFFIYFMTDRLSGDLNTGFMLKLGIVFFFMLIGIAFWTVIRSHAMAGPIYKTRQILRAAARGEFPKEPVCFRRGDAFIDLAADLNTCLSVMRENRAGLNRRQGETACPRSAAGLDHTNPDKEK